MEDKYNNHVPISQEEIDELIKLKEPFVPEPMEDRKKPKRVLIVGPGESGTAIVKAITDKGKDINVSYGCVPLDEETLGRINNAPCFTPEPFVITNITPTYQEPFIEKPRKKRRQHLFKR